MDARALTMGLLFVIMWSSAFTSARIAVVDAPPFLLLTVRFLISGCLALGVGWMLGQRLALSRTQWRSVILFGICQNTLYLGLNFTAMQWLDASVAVIIASTLPLLVAAAGWLFHSERLSRQTIAGLALGLTGVLIVMSSRLSEGADPVGVLLCVIGVLALTVATMLVRSANAGGGVWMIVGLQMLVGSATLLPLSLFLETWQVNWTLSLFLSFTYTTLIPGLAATLIWFLLVERVGATRAATFHFLNPFLGVAIAAVILGEAMNGRDIAGVIVIAGGILLVQLARR